MLEYSSMIGGVDICVCGARQREYVVPRLSAKLQR